MRNYKRYLGILLGTYWSLDEIELGVLDKVHDIVTGKYFFEKKIIRTKLGGIIDIQWIKERKAEEDFIEEEEAPESIGDSENV